MNANPPRETDDVVELTAELVRRPSITPDDAGCQALIADRLERLGFTIEWLPSGKVENLWARHGSDGPLVVLAGHTDVVPAGPLDLWTRPPFSAEIADGMIWGRGTADMKGSVAAMVVACERHVRDHPDHGGSIALLLTSDEEGPAVDGTRHVVEQLLRRDERIDYAIVGEPSSMDVLGDTLRIGRRGSLTGHLRVRGIQGHVAYPERAHNPVHAMAPALAELVAEQWDDGNAHFPPTTLQIAGIESGTGADNVIPAELRLVFNLRHATASSAGELKGRIRDILERHELDYVLDWRTGAEPFITEPGVLTGAMAEVIESVTGHRPGYSTAGGTSDARFLAPTGAQVVEFGPLNATIHQIDERVATDDLEACAEIFRRTLERLLT